MSKRVKGFIGLPGGLGTFEEVIECGHFNLVGWIKTHVFPLASRGYNLESTWNSRKTCVFSAFSMLACRYSIPDIFQAVVIVNVLGFFDPLRELIRTAVKSGFIHPVNVGLMVFVDGPTDLTQHVTYDWGTHAVEALQKWKKPEGYAMGFNWEKKLSERTSVPNLTSRNELDLT